MQSELALCPEEQEQLRRKVNILAKVRQIPVPPFKSHDQIMSRCDCKKMMMMMMMKFLPI